MSVDSVGASLPGAAPAQNIDRELWRERGWMPWYRYWWWRFGLWWNRARTQRELAEYEALRTSGNAVGGPSRGEEP